MRTASRAEPGLAVVLVEDDEQQARTFAAALRRRGHAVDVAREAERALAVTVFDVLVTDARLAAGLDGLELVAALRARGSRAPVVLVGGGLTASQYARACRLGVADVLCEPFSPAALVGAVEDAGRRAPQSAYESSYRHDEPSIERALRELVAFLVAHGVGPSHRGRVASALAQLLSVTAPRFVVAAAIEDGHVALEVAGTTPALERVLPLVHALGESVEHGDGRTVRAVFELWPAVFDEDTRDLSERDFLEPSELERVVAAARRRDAGLDVPRSLALTIGRVIARESEAPTVIRN